MAATFNAAIGYINLADAATISASSAQIQCPPATLQNPHVSRKWKTVTSSGEYLLIDLGSALSIDTLYLLGCSLSSVATSRVRISSSDSTGVSGDLYDSGTLTGAVDQNYGTLPVLLAAPVTGRYIRYDFTDSAASSIQAGRLFVGLRTQLQINFAYNWQLHRVDRSIQTATRGGQTQVFKDNQYRTLDLTFDFIADSDRYGIVEAVDIANGEHTDVLFILDPSSSNPARDSIWGLVTDLTPIIQPSFDVFSKEYKIAERL